MAQVDVFSFAAAVTALLIAIVLLIAHAFNPRLTAFRWWTGSFVLLAIWLATATLRLDRSLIAIKWLSWASLLAAACLLAYGLYREGASRAHPGRRILACSALFLALATMLTVTDARPPLWIVLGALPTIVFMAWSGLLVLRSGAHFYGLAILAGIAPLALRALSHPAGLAQVLGPQPPRPALRGGFGEGPGPGDPIALAPPPPARGLLDFAPPPGTRLPVEHALTVTLVTIAALVALAVILVLRDLLVELGRMRDRSRTDAMTGLLNRVTFEETAAAALDETGARPLCLVLFDIDHFKRVNDTAGHAAGDRVIITLGQVLGEMSLIRASAGRLGGEEFAVVLPDCDLGTARLYAEAIRSGFSASDFGDAVNWTVTLSAGIALLQRGESLHELTARADRALYAAKASGRDRVTLADAPSGSAPAWARAV